MWFSETLLFLLYEYEYEYLDKLPAISELSLLKSKSFHIYPTKRFDMQNLEFL